MRRLMLLRHAKTERAGPGERDRDRALMKRGRTDAAMLGAYMARQRLVPDLALVSPAVRARQTWTIVAAELAKPPRLVSDERIYTSNAAQLMEIIGETDEAPSLIVVGHNPTLHDLALQLIASGDTAARAELSEKLPTSGLVVVELPSDDWSLTLAQSARLEHFVTPRLIAAATD